MKIKHFQFSQIPIREKNPSIDSLIYTPKMRQITNTIATFVNIL